MSHELNLAAMLALIAGGLALFLFGLELMTGALAQADPSQAAKVLAAKGEIQELAESARKIVLAKLRLSEKKDVERLSLATDMIEHFKQVAYFARQIARIVEEWIHYRAMGSSPGGISVLNEAAGAELKQDLEVPAKASRKPD